MDKAQFNDLVVQAKQGNEEAFEMLVTKTKPLVTNIVNKFTEQHSKLEFEDLYNIALLGLFKTVKSFNIQNPSFLHQAKLIITRDLINEVKTQGRKKRSIWNTYTFDTVPPEQLIEWGDAFDKVDEKLVMHDIYMIARTKLSPYHNQIFEMYLQGKSNIEIANALSSTPKRINSALYRIKKKVVKEFTFKFLDN